MDTLNKIEEDEESLWDRIGNILDGLSELAIAMAWGLILFMLACGAVVAVFQSIFP